jgi:tetratricopeptide (TPR) repeat protein
MPSPALLFGLLATLVFSIATWIEPRQKQWSSRHATETDLLTLLAGDSRRMFANHFFVKADVYMHAGFYPSIFEQASAGGTTHLEEATEVTPHVHGPHCDHDHDHDHHHGHRHDHGHHHWKLFQGGEKDWIEALGRNFHPNRHAHLGGDGSERELLPWLKISAALDPTAVQSYAVAAYFLRKSLGKTDEAEQFLREGWHANPDSYVILLELGRLYREDKRDIARARNVLELGLQKWREQQAPLDEPDLFPYQQLLIHLARLEEEEGNISLAISYLAALEKISPSSETIHRQIEELKTQIPGSKSPTSEDHVPASKEQTAGRDS